MDKHNTRYQPPCADPRGSNTRASRATGHTLGHSTPKAVHIEPTLSEKSPTDRQIFWRCVLVSLCCLWGSWFLKFRLNSLIAAEDKEDDLMGRTVDEGGLWTPGFTSPPPPAPAACTSHSLSASSAFPRSLTVMAIDSYWLAVTRQSVEGESKGFSTPGTASEASHHCPTLKPGTALLPISPSLKGISLRPGESSSLPQGLTWWHRHSPAAGVTTINILLYLLQEGVSRSSLCMQPMLTWKIWCSCSILQSAGGS